MDPKKMADLLSRNLTLSTENLAPPGGKFKICNLILHFQPEWASNQNLLLPLKFSVKFCTFWDQDQVPLCPQDKFWIWRRQMKLAVFLDAIWAPLAFNCLFTLPYSLRSKFPFQWGHNFSVVVFYRLFGMQQQVCFYLLNCFCSIINLNFEWLLLTIDSPFRPPFPERLGCGAKVFFMILSLLADALLRWNKISVPQPHNPTSLETVVRRENLCYLLARWTSFSPKYLCLGPHFVWDKLCLFEPGIRGNF